jgi:hypothetical protein
MATEQEASVGAVYVGWNTFNNAIGTLVQAMPNRIDRTVFPGLAGGVQGQLLTGLRFLGLITKDGKPTDTLRALAVRDEAERKKQLVKVLTQSYPDLFALDLSKTTPGELREQMAKSYKVTGATTDRAIRFFISAASYAGIPISSHVTKTTKSTNGTTTNRRRRVARRKTDAGSATPAITLGGGESKTVKLGSGGTLTLSASIAFLSLDKSDRLFVFDLIDKLAEYEAAHPASEPDEPQDEEGDEA